MVRSAAKLRVSNHGAAPSFETRPSDAPQDEGGRQPPLDDSYFCRSAMMRRIIGAQRSISPCANLFSSAGVSGMVSMASRSIVLRISGRLAAFTITALILSTMSRGSFGGPDSENQVTDTK